MKRSGVVILLFLAMALRADVVLLEYFFQPGCGECEKVDAFVLPRLKERFSGRYELVRYDTGILEHYLKLVEAQERLGVKSGEPVAVIVNRRVYLGGYRKIDRELFQALESATPEAVDLPGPTAAPAPGLLRKRAETFTVGVIAAAGLVDGINPCVFATLVFFLSLLAVARIGGRKLLLAGSCYCLACFFTYFAMGFGLFRFLKLFSGYRRLQGGLELAMVALLLVLAFLSFRDAFRYRKTGKADRVALRLPERIRKRIHEIIRRGLQSRYLLPGAFVTGMLVTVLESVCTGQIYVPTLALMVKESGAGGRWVWYLLLYNAMFLLPLLLLFAAAWRGTTTRIFLDWSRKNAVYGKIAAGCLLLLLAALILIL